MRASAMKRSRNSSAIGSCRISREPAMQAWPWLWKIAERRAVDRGGEIASSNTMLAPLPPSSSCTCFRLPAEAWTILRPDRRRAGEGDLGDAGMLGQVLAGGVRRSPGTMLTTPGGKPTSAISSAIRSVRERRELGRLQHDACCRPRAPAPSSSS